MSKSLREILEELRNKFYWRGYNDHIKKVDFFNSKEESVDQALSAIEAHYKARQLEKCKKCNKTGDRGMGLSKRLRM